MNYEFKVGDIVKIEKDKIPFETTLEKCTITDITEEDGNIYFISRNHWFLADELTKTRRKKCKKKYLKK
tara:strand:- start:1359 stop:1565 length:207 start_codon:yes stop_codon:yes gene_type:complete